MEILAWSSFPPPFTVTTNWLPPSATTVAVNGGLTGTAVVVTVVVFVVSVAGVEVGASEGATPCSIFFNRLIMLDLVSAPEVGGEVVVVVVVDVVDVDAATSPLEGACAVATASVATSFFATLTSISTGLTSVPLSLLGVSDFLAFLPESGPFLASRDGVAFPVFSEPFPLFLDFLSFGSEYDSS